MLWDYWYAPVATQESGGEVKFFVVAKNDTQSKMRLSKRYFQVPTPFKTKSRSCTDIVCLVLFIFCLVSCHLSSGIVQYHPAEKLPGLSASLSRHPFLPGGLGSSGSHSLQGWRPQKGKHSLT